MFWEKIREITKIVHELPISDILVPEDRIRRSHSDASVLSLAGSIRTDGILEPLIVRKADENVSRETIQPFILTAGERRLRAASIAGLSTVPCVVIEADEVNAAAVMITENLHRANLSFFEEAEAISSLIRLTGMTQDTCARRLCVSQSYVANKIRLLRLTEEERTLILEHGLTERHSRALLRFEDPAERLEILKTIASRRMNVAQAEEYVESMICAKSRCEELRSKPEKSEQRRRLMMRDIVQFCSSIDSAVEVIRKSGIAVESSRKETERGTVISIVLQNAG